MAFLINGIVLGVHDVSDGSSQAALDTLKAELYKMGESINRIVSSTSDGASTQRKFNRLLGKYYITSCNAGCVFYLKKATIAFFKGTITN